MEFIPFNQVPLPQATALWNQAFSDYMIPIEMSEEALAKRLTDLQLSPSMSLVAMVEGQLAGIMLYGHHLLNGEKIAWIGGMGVHPDYRRVGVAQALIGEAVQMSEKLGVNRLLLEVIKGNERAEALYRRLGFDELNRVSFSKGQLTKRYVNRLNMAIKTAPLSEEIWQKQETKTTWQNTFISSGVYRRLIVEQEQVGYLYCSEIMDQGQVSSLIVKQLVLFNQCEGLVESVLACLFDEYGDISVNFSNFDLDWPVTLELHQLRVVEELQQIQMERFINENLESKL